MIHLCLSNYGKISPLESQACFILYKYRQAHHIICPNIQCIQKHFRQTPTQRDVPTYYRLDEGINNEYRITS